MLGLELPPGQFSYEDKIQGSSFASAARRACINNWLALV